MLDATNQDFLNQHLRPLGKVSMMRDPAMGICDNHIPYFRTPGQNRTNTEQISYLSW